MIFLAVLGISPFSLSCNIKPFSNRLFFIALFFMFPFIKSSVPSKNGAASVNQFLGYAGISTVGWIWSKQDGKRRNMRKQWDEVDRYHDLLTHSIDLTDASPCTFMHTGWYYKMESKNSNCKRLKREDDDGVRAGGEGNITACRVFPLLEEQIPGTETCYYAGFEFRAALFLIDDIICGPLSLLHTQHSHH